MPLLLRVTGIVAFLGAVCMAVLWTSAARVGLPPATTASLIGLKALLETVALGVAVLIACLWMAAVVQHLAAIRRALEAAPAFREDPTQRQRREPTL